MRAWRQELDVHALALGDRVWVPGHSPVSDGKAQLERQLEILEQVRVPPQAVALHFHEPGFTRRGQHFDMESLGYVVLRPGGTT